MKPSSLPKISIVTPTYNSEAYLEYTILSVINQGYPNLEYIVIDGGSTDKTIEIIKKYEKDLTYWVSEKDNGVYDAVQKGFEKSTGDIMAWIGSDDLYHKSSFTTVAKIFIEFKQINWLVGASSWFNEKGTTIEVKPSKWMCQADFIFGNYKWLQQETCFWRRSIWEQSGANLNLNYKLAGDFELWTRYSSITNLYVTKALIGGFRMRSNNQLSLDHFEQYENEVNDIRLLKRKILKKETSILTYFRIWISQFKLIKKMGKYKKRYTLEFDRLTQKFYLKIP